MYIRVLPQEFDEALDKTINEAINENLMLEPSDEEANKLESIFCLFLEYLGIDSYEGDE